MDLFEAIYMRRSIKGFSSEAVPRETLLELVDAARYSPSGSNKNPWQFVFVTQRDTIEKLSQVQPYCRWLNAAQAAIAIVVDPKATRYWLEDCSLAAQTIWLAGVGLGLGLAWAAMHQSDNPTESERRQSLVRGLLAIPDTLYVPIVLGVGYPGAAPPEKKRPELDGIVSWEKYSR